ncbi:MAG TPA: tRNA (adenosine(37)-N6)-dimethylallyltransferase MiaA [Patescibacteria group bacterium]|nr:tRNA (adenosine(37)-N6)-dimethylallyltransferase MiaA [Patescibacteria group bacterium]
MKRALFIVGPTAVGKTDLAFFLSSKISSILISADSVQVYRGADIISGKDKAVHTELIDVSSPYEQFSVRDFVMQVQKLVNQAKTDNKIPIIVGGTGFYLDALFGKYQTVSIPPNDKLREELSNNSIEELQEKLTKLNTDRFERMNNSDRNNSRRLVRAIEIAQEKSVIDLPAGEAGHAPSVFSDDGVLIVGLKTSMDKLREKIEERVDKRIEMGALDEAKSLFANYERLSRQLKDANGYREIFDYLLGNMDFDEAKQRWINADYQHAKNQMTWFARNPNIKWFDPNKNGIYEEILKLVKSEISP